MTHPYTIIIPARYASTRLPGKPLRDIAGKPLIQHVFSAASSCNTESIYVATDDKRIYDTVIAFGGKAIITSDTHQSGTERLAEAVELLNLSDEHIVVNLQGDEPGVSPLVIQQAVDALLHSEQAAMSTIAEKINDPNDIHNLNIVKLVIDKDNLALYFSRSVIPYQRDTKSEMIYFRHVGLYAYRVAFLKQYAQMPFCILEQAECLEQLRVLYNGYKIAVAVTTAETGTGIDTEADVEKFLQHLSAN